MQITLYSSRFALRSLLFALVWLKLQKTLLERAKGTGAGLAIVKRIVEGDGGSIRVESDRGQGASFYFSLPAV